MIDLRYLGLTLMGIFLALAIGLMTGSALGGPDKRDAAYEALRSQFELLRADNQRVRDEIDAATRRLDAREQALRELLPGTVQNRLSRTTVGVFLCGGVNERRLWGELEGTLRLAGAEIGPVLRVPDSLRPLPPEARAEFARVWGEGEDPDQDPLQSLDWVVRALTRGGTSQRLEELARSIGVELRGSTPDPVQRLLVLTTYGEGERSAMIAAGSVPELRLVDAARREGVILVAAEPEEAPAGMVDFLGRHGVSTIDNINSAAGQISTVLALAGARGRFGSKPGANRPLPSLEQP